MLEFDVPSIFHRDFSIKHISPLSRLVHRADIPSSRFPHRAGLSIEQIFHQADFSIEQISPLSRFHRAERTIYRVDCRRIGSKAAILYVSHSNCRLKEGDSYQILQLAQILVNEAAASRSRNLQLVNVRKSDETGAIAAALLSNRVTKRKLQLCKE